MSSFRHPRAFDFSHRPVTACIDIARLEMQRLLPPRQRREKSAQKRGEKPAAENNHAILIARDETFPARNLLSFVRCSYLMFGPAFRASRFATAAFQPHA